MMAPVAVLLAVENEEDRAFITQIYLDYRKLMYAVAMEIVRDPQIAEDMIFAALTEMIERMEVLRGIDRCRLRSYIASIVRNNSIDHVRRQKRRRPFIFLPKDEDMLNRVAAEGEVDDGVMQEAEIEALRAGLKRLSESERMLLTMKYADGMDDRSIAAILGIGKESVRTYLSRTRIHLRQIMREGEEHG